MKKVRLFSLAAIVALSSFISAEAVHYFREHYNEGVLMKRPNGGILDFQ